MSEQNLTGIIDQTAKSCAHVRVCIQWNLSNAVTYGPTENGCITQVAALENNLCNTANLEMSSIGCIEQ